MSTADFVNLHVGRLPPKDAKMADAMEIDVANVNESGIDADAASLHSTFFSTPQLPRPEEMKLLRLWEALLDEFDADERPRQSARSATSILYSDDKQRHNFLVKSHQTPPSQTSGDDEELNSTSLRSLFWEQAVRNDHPDAILQRFLVQQKGDVSKALTRNIAAIRWRKTSNLQQLMLKGEEGFWHVAQDPDASEQDRRVAQGFINLMDKGFVFFRGHDRVGRPLSFARLTHYKRTAQPFKSMSEYIIWSIEIARLVINPGLEGLTQIFDLSNMHLLGMDLYLLRYFIELMRENYPRGIGLICVHQAPRFFESVWVLIRSALSQETVQKIHFTRTVEDLAQFIDPCHIPADMGGTSDFEYSYPPPVPGENDTMRNESKREKLLLERAHLALQFERCTRSWIRAARRGDRDLDDIRQERDETSNALREVFWKLDPYVRARCFYDRWNVTGAPSVMASSASSSIDVQDRLGKLSLDAGTQTEEWLDIKHEPNGAYLGAA